MYSCLLPVLLVVLLLMSIPLHAEGLGKAVDVAFKAKVDGSEQRYVQMLPEPFDAGAPHDLLIALHGHGSDRWQYVTQERGECKGARDIAAKYGMIYVSPDYRAATSWMGPKAEADVVQIIADLKGRYKIGKVILAGASMGGSAVLTFASIHPELVDGVCSENGTANLLEYANFQEAISASFGGTKQQIPAEYKKRSAEYWPERLTMPIAFTTGGKDAAVPPQSVLRLANILTTLKRKVLLIHREEGDHVTTYEDTVAALEFVVKAVRGDEKSEVRGQKPD